MLICISKGEGTLYFISYLRNEYHFNSELFSVTYIKEDRVSVGITIIPINAIESLRELDIANLLSYLGVHQETHGLPRSFAVVNVVITIQVQHERSIGKHRRDTNLKILKSINRRYEKNMKFIKVTF